MEDFMTTAEAASMLDIAQVSIIRLIRKNVLKAKKFGHIYMVDRESVEAYQKANEGKSRHDPSRKLTN